MACWLARWRRIGRPPEDGMQPLLFRRPRHDARPSCGTARPIATVILVAAAASAGLPLALLDRGYAQLTDRTEPVENAADPFAGELHPLRERGAEQPVAPPPVPAARLPVAPLHLPVLPVPFPEAAATPPPPSDNAALAPSPPEQEAEAYLHEALEARRRGDLERSVDLCSRGLAISPDHPELLLRRGIAWFHLGMFGIAAEDFADAAAIAYDDPRPELWRGLTAIEQGRLLEAVSGYSEAIRRDRSFLLAYLNRGLAYLEVGEPAKAERDFDHAIRHNPRDVRAWFHRGVAATQRGRLTDAVRSYETALRIDPGHQPSRRNLAAIRGRATRP